MLRLDDRTNGGLVCGAGVGAFGFGIFGIGVLLLQRLAIGLGSFTATPANPTFVDAMFALHRIAFVTLSLLVTGGSVLILSGIYLRKGSQTARRVAQVTAWSSYLLFPGMMIACYLNGSILEPLSGLPGWSPAMKFVVRCISTIGGTIIAAVFPTVLLYLLKRPPNPTNQPTQQTHEL